MPGMLHTSPLSPQLTVMNMLTRASSILASCIFGCVLLESSFAGPTIQSQGTQSRHVLLIGIDGVRSDALQAANTPALDGLIASGAVTWDAFAGGPGGAGNPSQQATSSGPGWASMLTGVWVDKHGVGSNGAFASGNFSTYPHFFARIRSAHPNAYLASVVQWHPINQNMLLPYPGLASFAAQVPDAGTAVRDAAVLQLSSQDPEVLFLHFDDVDHAGHGFGFSVQVPEYLAAIEETDANIASVLAAIGARPNVANEDWLVVVSTDHGGSGTGHGGQSAGERRIFVIASGGEVVQGTFQPGPGHTVVPSTVLKHLQIPVDPIWGLEPQYPFGFRQPQASWPSPCIGEIGLGRDLTLDWLGGEGAIVHDVYLGTSPMLGMGDLVGTILQTSLVVNGLQEEQVYYWRVDTVRSSGTLQGEVWSFETAGNFHNEMVLYLPVEGDAVNAVGIAPDGTLVGGPAFAAGQQGQSLSLDASGNFVDLAAPVELDFADDTDFTVSLWLRSNGWAQDPVLVSNKNWNSGANVGWLLAADPDGVSWQWNLRGSTGNRVDFDAIAPVADGTWHHVCVVHDRDGLASFYTDGVLNGTRSIAGQGSVTSGLQTALGQDGTLTYGLNLIADLDDLRIWRRALGPDEVEHLVSGMDPTVGTRYCDGFPNTESDGGRMLALGSPTLVDNDLRLFGLELPSGQPGIFFYGPNPAYVPTAGGIRCVGGQLFRIHPATFGGAGGTIEQRVDLAAYPFDAVLQAGLTHRFQLWYRDPTSSVATSNFTDGLAIQFQ